MKILLTGSSGFVGSEFKEFLEKDGNDVYCLIRDKILENEKSIFWSFEDNIIDSSQTEGMDCIIHLAGESIAAKRWTIKQKYKIRQSRIKSTKFLIKTISKLQSPPKLFLCASAIGFYGDSGDKVVDENTSGGEGFLAEVCRSWEHEGQPLRNMGIRVVNMRFGMILNRKGGALKKMLLPFKLGLGGRTGNGRQYISWISLDDVVSAIQFIIKNDKIEGPVNFVSPNPVTNKHFAKTLAKVLHRPAIFPLPAIIARLLLGEMADELLLSSIRVEPAVLMQNGFAFKHETFKLALKNIL